MPGGCSSLKNKIYRLLFLVSHQTAIQYYRGETLQMLYFFILSTFSTFLYFSTTDTGFAFIKKYPSTYIGKYIFLSVIGS